MYTHTSTKSNATKIKSVIDRVVLDANCEIIRDCSSYRIADNRVSSAVFARVRDLIEAGNPAAKIALSDIIEN